MNVREPFKSMALTTGGINGGNPAGAVWFCGIEFGSHLDPKSGDGIARPLSAEGIPHWDDAFLKQIDASTRHTNAAQSFQYIQKIARIALVIETGRSPSLHEVKTYIQHRLSRPAGDTFQLNLYPLPFPGSGDGHYGAIHQQYTGLPGKTMYRAWCMEHRFPVLRALLEKHQPRALVCAGISFSSDFKLAFLEPERIFAQGEDIALKGTKKRVRRFKLNSGKTTMMLTPFLGAGGLMSHAQLDALGHLLRAPPEG